jgi:curved DNA-binding protein CbpA
MPKDPNSRPAEALYVRLEVRPDASRQEIVSAYRRLAHGAHPDARPGDPEAAQRFREITEAYDVLSDPLRRASYDRSRVHERRDVTRQSEVVQQRSDKPRANPQPGVPITLGIDLPPTRPSAFPLWAGPVRVEPETWSKRSNSLDPVSGPSADMAWLLSQILESWRRY